MPYRVTLTFVIGDEDEAWDIADGLEQAALRKNYREVNGYVTAEGRGSVLGTEEKPVASSAETLERRQSGDAVVTMLGDEHGRSG